MLDSDRLREVLDSLPDAVLVCDREGLIRHCNRNCESLFGYAPAELLGRSIELLVPAELRGAHGRLRRHYANEPRPRPMEAMQNIEALRKDGKRQPVSVALSPLAMTQEALTIVSVRDNTAAVEARRREREEFERYLRAQRLENIGLLSCGIAHDLKNLVTVVLGNADLALMADTAANPGQHRCLQSIQSAALHLRELSSQMLSYATGTDTRQQAANLNESVKTMSVLLRASLPPGIRLHSELARELPQLPVDTAQVSQVLLNLILNASEAIGNDGGNITVRTGSSDDHVYVEVEDDGCGIDDGVRQHMLAPFFTTKTGGKGLGLSVVNGIVDRHGGRLDIRSRPGEGSVFQVRFPLSPP